MLVTMLQVRPVTDAGRDLVFNRLCRERGFKLTRGGFLVRWEDFTAIEIGRNRDSLQVSATGLSMLSHGAFISYFTKYRARAERARPTADEIAAMLAQAGMPAEVVFIDIRPHFWWIIPATGAGMLFTALLIIKVLELLFPQYRSH